MPSGKRGRRSAREVGLPRAEREMWTRMYAGPLLRNLPWFTQGPYPPLARAVEAGWLPRPGPILDVGCGLGTNTFWLAAQGFRSTGIDVAPGAIEAAESRRTSPSLDATFRVDDVIASRLPQRSFGGAVDVGCFQTLPSRSREGFAGGLGRLLRPQAPYLLFWVAREETGSWGPPHRLSVTDVTDAFEPHFRVEHVEHRPRTVSLTAQVKRSARPLTVLAGYTARLVRRAGPQPPPR